ncbi:hypothetical protein [Demequina sp.]|uniref:hypothetical protein n=1 Tax=Demequina sp. TaxID=2050685 RepID=UPI003D0A323F
MAYGNRLQVHDKFFACLVCGGDRFEQREILMNTAGATFFDFDAFNRAADGAICVSCGFVHQFAGEAHVWLT